MRRALTIAIVATLALGGCKKWAPSEEASDNAIGHGRYVGIGIYSINELWKHLVQPKPPKGAPARNPQAALLSDDTEIVVIVDSRTGEVRQCGNYSGYCISSNPWKVQAASSPAILTEHAEDLEREQAARQRQLEEMNRTAAQIRDVAPHQPTAARP